MGNLKQKLKVAGMVALGLIANVVPAVAGPFAAREYSSIDIMDGGAVPVKGSMTREYSEFPINENLKLWAWNDQSNKNQESKEIDVSLRASKEILNGLEIGAELTYWDYPRAKFNDDIVISASAEYKKKISSDLALETNLAVTRLLQYQNTKAGTEIIGEVKVPIKINSNLTLSPYIVGAWHNNYFEGNGFAHFRPGVKASLKIGDYGTLESSFQKQFSQRSDTESINFGQLVWNIPF